MKELVKAGKKIKLKKIKTIKGEEWMKIKDPAVRKEKKAKYQLQRSHEAHRFSKQPSLEDVILRYVVCSGVFFEWSVEYFSGSVTVFFCVDLFHFFIF